MGTPSAPRLRASSNMAVSTSRCCLLVSLISFFPCLRLLYDWLRGCDRSAASHPELPVASVTADQASRLQIGMGLLVAAHLLISLQHCVTLCTSLLVWSPWR